MKAAYFFLVIICAFHYADAMRCGDSKQEVEQLKRFIAEHGIAAITQEAREYFEEKGVNFSHLALPENHSPSGDYHRMVVEEFIKQFGKDAVCPAIRNQIVANGWHKESEIMAQFAPEPQPLPALNLFEQHKIPLLLVAALAVGLLSYEIFACNEDEEKQEVNS